MFNSSDDQTYALLERNNLVVPVHLRTILSSLNLLRPREYNSVGGRGHCGSCWFRKFRSGDPKGQGRSVLRVSGEVSAENIKKINAYCLSPRFGAEDSFRLPTTGDFFTPESWRRRNYTTSGKRIWKRPNAVGAINYIFANYVGLHVLSQITYKFVKEILADPELLARKTYVELKNTFGPLYLNRSQKFILIPGDKKCLKQSLFCAAPT